MSIISYGTTCSLCVLVRLHWTRILCWKTKIYKIEKIKLCDQGSYLIYLNGYAAPLVWRVYIDWHIADDILKCIRSIKGKFSISIQIYLDVANGSLAESCHRFK